MEARRSPACTTFWRWMVLPLSGIMSNSAAHQGEQGLTRATFDFSQAGRYTFRQEVSPDGQQWFPFLAGNYTLRE